MSIDKEVHDRLKRREPFPRRLQTIVEMKGIKTGSKVFGGYIKGESDIDWLLIHDPAFLQEITRFAVYTHTDYSDSDFTSYYIKTQDDEIWNLLIMRTPATFEIWAEATRAVRRLKNEPRIETALLKKSARIEAFETMLGLIRNGMYTQEESAQTRSKTDPLAYLDSDIPF